MLLFKKEDVKKLDYVACCKCDGDIMISCLDNDTFSNNSSDFVECPHCLSDIVIERHYVYISQPF